MLVDVHGLAVRRHGDALRRDAARELEARLREDPVERGRVLVDAEDFDLVRVHVGDEQEIAPDEHLLGAASLDDLLAGRVVVQIEDLPRHGNHGQIASEIDIPENEQVGRSVEHVQFAAEIVEGRGLRRVRHHGRVAEGRAVVPDGDAVHELRHAVPGLPLVQYGVGLLSGDEAPLAGDLHVRGQAAHGHHLDERVRVIGHVDDGDGVAQGVCDIEGIPVRGEVQVARMRALQIVRAGRYLRDLRELRSRIDAEGAHLVFDPVGCVQAGAGLVESRLFRVKAELELADHVVGLCVDHGREIRVLVQDNDVGRS